MNVLIQKSKKYGSLGGKGVREGPGRLALVS
jgi:hypothetical protein